MSYEVAAKHHRLQNDAFIMAASRYRLNQQLWFDAWMSPIEEGTERELVTYNNWHPVVVEGFGAEGGAW